MNSNPPILGKSLSASSSTSTYSSGLPQAGLSASFEANRRQSQSPSSSHIQGAPRKSQGAKKQHRNQRRPMANPALNDEDAVAEFRAVRNTMSRRGQTSITHLLNYSRPYHEIAHSAYSRSYRRNPTWGPGSGYHPAHKARYVHANYRFVVTPAGNYSKHAKDADEYLQWADVMQVLASAESQQASCPICLGEPVAPRMAECGHIFCLSCLIRFMNSSLNDDKGTERKQQQRWRKCPICDDTIQMTDVRPVRFYAGQESPLPRPGDDVILRLMVRNADSTLALPKEGGVDVLNSGDDIPWHFAATALDYARIMKGTGDYMEAEFNREIEEIEQQEIHDELLYHEDNEWSQRAVRSIKAAIEKTGGVGVTEATVSSAIASSSQPRKMEHDFYFYTSPSHLYLSPLDIRILKTQFGSFSAFPTTLLPRVEHISTGHVVDDALRKRAKYLGHLPHGCVISLLECNWTDIVPADILGSFADEIERRRKRNRDKAAQEERERLQAERAEAAALRGARRTYGATDEEVTVRFGASPSETAAINPDDFQPLGAVGATPPYPRPGFTHLQNMSTSPSASRTVWGTAAVPVSPEIGPVRNQPPVDDGWLKDDRVLEELGAAELSFQMEALGIEAAAGSTDNSNTGGSKIKKKKQKITLMTNGGRRGN